MNPAIRNILVYPAVLLFLAANLWLMTRDVYVLNLLPVVILLGVVAFLSIDRLLLIIVFFTPLSIPMKHLVGEIGVDLFLPTEPLLAGVMILFIWKVIREKNADLRILLHPLAVVIYIYLFWMVVTSLTSTMPLVSLKHTLARMWFITGYFFVAAHVFRDFRNMKHYLWAYILSLTLVIFYTLFNQYQYGLFNQQASHSTVHPFYNDHTAYGAALAFLIPVLAGFVSRRNEKITHRIFPLTFLIIFLVALVFSYTRAAWVSLVAAGVVFLLIRFRISFTSVVFFLLAGVAFLFMYRTEVMMELEANKETSSTDFATHVRSITNITSDASNAERINRWKTALRMFREKPVYGWGPGTYQFKYAGFQMKKERTYISTNFGDLGNAHSEYLGPLSESGLPGLLTVLALAGASVFTGLRVIRRARDKLVITLALSLLLGLVTYFTHGFLNNFLHTDKASALFWGFMAMLVALDVYHIRGVNPEVAPEENIQEL
ncbi:MAG: O-antigen ligase family protein [Bacteroidales bacterium]